MMDRETLWIGWMHMVDIRYMLDLLDIHDAQVGNGMAKLFSFC